jgi:hypothetical protein
MSESSVARDAHLAYLNRKLDIQERVLALKERELALQERAMELREQDAEAHRQAIDGLESLREQMHSALGLDADDDMPTPSFASRGRS